jgi:adenine-specific DNA-methyltransferase
MAGQRTKLELTWIGKENRPRLELRILLEDPERSYHAARRVAGRFSKRRRQRGRITRDGA